MKKKDLYGMKFEGVDLLSVMGSIVDSHVEHYRSDFDLDREILTEAAGKKDRSERTYLWLCRTMGTWLLSERKHGIIERENYNKPKSPDSKQPGCPQEKVKAIEDAMRHFQMI